MIIIIRHHHILSRYDDDEWQSTRVNVKKNVDD